jgi:hypothetical protein
VAILELLQQATDANLEKFVEIVGGDGKKFHTFEQRIARISGFFEHPPIKFEPRGFAVEKGRAVAQRLSSHIFKPSLSNPIVKVERRWLFGEVR